jgi:hypothetical protein
MIRYEKQKDLPSLYGYFERVAKEAGLSFEEYHLLPAVITSNPKTPSRILRIYAQSSDEKLLERLAGNPSTPWDILSRLVRHKSKAIRLAVANNRNAPSNAIEALICDDSPSVRFMVAENPFMPNEMLVRLVDDENPFVAHRAETTLQRVQREAS